VVNSIQIRIKFKSKTVAATTMVHLGALWELVAVAGIDMDKLFKPSTELQKYIENARQKETDLLQKRKSAMAKINWL
jgi:hypothetical protein